MEMGNDHVDVPVWDYLFPQRNVYVWGDPSKETSVLCDGKIIMVTQNFKDALLQPKLKERS
jgi:hypothetical protein